MKDGTMTANTTEGKNMVYVDLTESSDSVRLACTFLCK